MTGAERVRRWRELRGATKPVTKQEAVARALEQKVAEQAAEIERLRLKAGPEIDPQTLSMTAQQKLEAAIRQAKRRLSAEYEEAVQEGIEQAINETVLPQYLKEMAGARQVIESRKGVMKRAEYRLIAAALHPDQSMSKGRLQQAFVTFTKYELTLCAEREIPTTAPRVPRTYEEMMCARAEMQARRRKSSKGMQRA
jgi:hypothetical protein